MKPSVTYMFLITPLHFLNAGAEGVLHFNFLLKLLISDINTASIEELNTVYALFLHKGHGKPKTSDRSYRTISTCPVWTCTYMRSILINGTLIKLLHSTKERTAPMNLQLF